MVCFMNLQKSLEALRDPDRLWRREKRPFWLFRNLLIMVSGSSVWKSSCKRSPQVRTSSHSSTSHCSIITKKQLIRQVYPPSRILSVQCRSGERCQALCSRGSTSPLSWSSSNPLAERWAEIWDMLAGSFNDSFARKRYSEAPFFYKYLPLPLPLSLSLWCWWIGPSLRADEWPRNCQRTALWLQILRDAVVQLDVVWYI